MATLRTDKMNGPVPAVVKARTPGNPYGYDVVTDLDGVPDYYKRCRRTQYFIMDEDHLDELENHDVTCPVCKEAVRDSGARGQYYPKQKKMYIMHYECSWKVTLNLIMRMGGM